MTVAKQKQLKIKRLKLLRTITSVVVCCLLAYLFYWLFSEPNSYFKTTKHSLAFVELLIVIFILIFVVAFIQSVIYRVESKYKLKTARKLKKTKAKQEKQKKEKANNTQTSNHSDSIQKYKIDLD